MQLIKPVPKQARQKATKHVRMFLNIRKGERIMQNVMSKIDKISKFVNILASISSIVVAIISIVMYFISKKKADVK